MNVTQLKPRDSKVFSGVICAGILAAQPSAREVYQEGLGRLLITSPMPPIESGSLSFRESNYMPVVQATGGMYVVFGSPTRVGNIYTLGHAPTLAPTVSIRERLLQRDIATYEALQDGWDDEGSFAPSSSALGDMRSFLDLLPAGIAIPKALLSSSGIPGLYWDERDYFMDIEFHGGGDASLFLTGKRNAAPHRIYSEHASISEAATAMLSAVSTILT